MTVIVITMKNNSKQTTKNNPQNATAQYKIQDTRQLLLILAVYILCSNALWQLY